jgi:hypothetical protein
MKTIIIKKTKKYTVSVRPCTETILKRGKRKGKLIGTLRITGLFTLRRLRLARLLGLEKLQSGYSPFVRFFHRQILGALETQRPGKNRFSPLCFPIRAPKTS